MFLSLEEKPLQTKDLQEHNAPVTLPTASERARERIREEMTLKRLSQREVSDLLGGVSNGWSQSRIAKLLTASVEMGLDDAAALAFAVGISLTEVVRDRGMEFYAEMTPTELRILERIRQLPKPIFEALLTLIDVRSHTKLEARGATKSKPAFSRK